MKRTLLAFLAVGSMAATALPVMTPSAFAQGPRAVDWKPLSERQSDVARRIEAGVASGKLTDLQAKDLRDQFKGLMNLEDQYRQSGLTLHQREDLQARYDTLDARLRLAANEADYRPAATTEVRIYPAPAN
jgi:hypothetical protein